MRWPEGALAQEGEGRARLGLHVVSEMLRSRISNLAMSKESVNVAANGRTEKRPWTHDEPPDVVLVEIAAIRLLADHGGAVDKHLRWLGLSGRTGIIGVVDGPDDHALVATVRAGAHGLLVHDDPLEHFASAVNAVAAGAGWVSPSLVPAVLRLSAGVLDPAAAVKLDRLTARERETLRHVAEGLSNAAMAEKMHVSVSTVKYHISNLLRKMNCRDRAELVLLVHTSGLAGEL